MLNLLDRFHKEFVLEGTIFNLNKKEYRFDLVRGLLSNYSLCCIHAFLRRWQGRILRKGTGPQAERYQAWWERTEIEEDIDRYKKKFQHVLCRDCLEGYRTENYQPVYYYCEACDWNRFQKQVCNLCGELGEPDTPDNPKRLADGRTL